MSLSAGTRLGPYEVWSEDDTILYAQGPGGIWRVPAAGGTAEQVVKLEAGESADNPQLLPGGRAVLFTLGQGASWDDAAIVVQSLDDGARRVVVKGGNDARYLPTGHLVYAHRGTLLAASFAPGGVGTAAGAVPVVENVAQSSGFATGAAQFSVSRDGMLVYMPASELAVRQERRIVWVDQRGNEEPIPAPPRLYLAPRLAPDGQRLAFLHDTSGDIDVWAYDFRRGIFERLTADPGRDSEAVWSPDGERLAFVSDRDDGNFEIYVMDADGSGQANLTADPAADREPSWAAEQ